MTNKEKYFLVKMADSSVRPSRNITPKLDTKDLHSQEQAKIRQGNYFRQSTSPQYYGANWRAAKIGNKPMFGADANDPNSRNQLNAQGRFLVRAPHNTYNKRHMGQNTFKNKTPHYVPFRSLDPSTGRISKHNNQYTDYETRRPIPQIRQTGPKFKGTNYNARPALDYQSPQARFLFRKKNYKPPVDPNNPL